MRRMLVETAGSAETTLATSAADVSGSAIVSFSLINTSGIVGRSIVLLTSERMFVEEEVSAMASLRACIGAPAEEP